MSLFHRAAISIRRLTAAGGGGGTGAFSKYLAANAAKDYSDEI